MRFKAYAKDENDTTKLFTATVKKLDGMSTKDFNTLVKQKTLLFEEGLTKGFFKLRDYEMHLSGFAPKEEKQAKTQNKSKEATFSDVASSWLNYVETHQSKAYYIRAKDSIANFIPIFGEKPIKLITRKMLKDAMRELQSKVVTTVYYSFKINLNALIEQSGLDKGSFCIKTNISLQTFRKLNKGLKAQYKTVKKICDFLQLDIDSCTEKQITEYGTIQPATLSGYRRILSRIFTEAEEDELIEQNPMMHIKIGKDDAVKKISKDKVLNYTDAQVLEKYLNDVNDKNGNPDYVKRIALLLPIYMGLRAGEVNGLKWSDINFDTNEISVKTTRQYIAEFGTFEKGTKTQDSMRVISMPNKLRELLIEYKSWWNLQDAEIWGDMRTTDYLLLNYKGQPYSVGTPSRWLKRALKACNLKDVNYHSLRHLNISLQIMNGVPITTVAHRAGHKDSNVTLKVYRHFMKEDDINAAHAIDDIFSKKN